MNRFQVTKQDVHVWVCLWLNKSKKPLFIYYHRIVFTRTFQTSTASKHQHTHAQNFWTLFALTETITQQEWLKKVVNSGRVWQEPKTYFIVSVWQSHKSINSESSLYIKSDKHACFWHVNKEWYTNLFSWLLAVDYSFECAMPSAIL